MALVDPGFSNSINPVTPGGGPTDPFAQPANNSGWNPSMLPKAQGGVFAEPGAFGNPGTFNPQTPKPAVDPQIARLNGGGQNQQNALFMGGNFKPTFENHGGYNPSQYADTATSNTLAGALGANVAQTRNAPGSPIGPPPQAMLDFGGSDLYNSGLVAERYSKYDKATADQMMKDELALSGPRQAPNADSEGGAYGSWSQYGDRPGGQQSIGQGQNMGQYLGTNPGGAFGSQPANAGAVPISQYQPPTPQQQTPYQPQQPQQPQYQQPRPRPQFGTNQNYGGFGAAGQFQNANQGGQMQQLMQMLLGGGGNTMQTLGRRSPFQAGSMSGMAGAMNQMGGGGRAFNPFSQGQNFGSGAGLMGYYPRYR